MTDPFVTVDRSDGILTLTLNRPDRANAIPYSAWEELHGVFTEIALRATDRCVVLTGAGSNFSSGGDMEGRTEQHMLLFMRTLGRTISALHHLPMPTIAKVRGAAVGAGASLALACDLVVAASTARFSQIFVRRGLSVDGGASWMLPRRVGLAKAKELAFFGDWTDAEEAERIGLVNRVVADDDLDQAVADWAGRLAAGPPLALSLDKTLLDNAFAATLDQALEDEARAQAVNFGSRDIREAYKASVEKRPPVFEGA